MKIAILTSGILPVPAVQGGAVENLIDFCLEYNDKHRLHDITVYSVWHPDVNSHPALQSDANHYHYISTDSSLAKIKRRIYYYLHGGHEYYHYAVEYFLQQTIRHLRRQQYDLILIENRPGFVIKLSKITSTPIVIHQENDYLNTEVPHYREIYDATSCIINTSAYITRRVQTICPNDTKCHTVLNGIDVNRFYQARPLPRNTLQLNDSDFVIIFSGRLTQEKGILELIQAIGKLHQLHHLRLLIIGASFYGSDMTKTPFIHQLEQAAQTLHDRVVFTGYVDYQAVPSYLKMADIAVLPSMWEEPFGLTIVEAMAAGLPLITTRSGGIPEICEGIATIVERENIVNNLADAILNLYQHPEKRQAMSLAALQRATYFNKERYAREFYNTLASIQ